MNRAIADGSPVTLRDALGDARRYWERWRIAYNLVLVSAVAGWLWWTWPHFRNALSLRSVTLLAVLAAIANLCYCAAYLADIPLQYSSLRPAWRRWRWCVWLAGTFFALLLANYWIADEIYPYTE